MNSLKQLITQHYNYLFEDELIDEIASVAQLIEVKAGDVIMDYGQNIKGMPLLIEGAIKILRQDKDGDELALYYLERGDTCTMTMTCCMGHQKSEIKAIAEVDAKFLLVPVEKMKVWTKQYDSWMAFVFESYNSRFNELLESIDNLAFHNMHERLHKFLKDQVMIKKTTSLELSHQDIAYDMHTSRVVISRLLKGLEKDGAIQLGRNRIEVLNF